MSDFTLELKKSVPYNPSVAIKHYWSNSKQNKYINRKSSHSKNE